MDLMRRAASGRLSEIAGPATLPIDRMMRTLGLRQRAVADFATLPPIRRAMLEAYARGVNAWIDLKGRFAAPEFLVLGAPEPWAADRQPAVGEDDGTVAVDELAAGTGPAGAGRHVPGGDDRSILAAARPAVPAPDAMKPPSTRFAEAASRLLAVLPQFPASLYDALDRIERVGGRWTAHARRGAPLLAGDPHLAFSFPGIWYLARIDMPGRVLAGATAPGVPFLVLGSQRKNRLDLHHHRRRRAGHLHRDAGGSGRIPNPDWPETIRVCGRNGSRFAVRPTWLLTVRETRHGPVISDLDHPDGPIMAVAMGNLQPADTAAAGLLALNRAGIGSGSGSRGHGDQFAGAEPAGGGREDHRDVRHRPGADPQGRRWVRAGPRRWIARLDRMGLRRAVAAQRLAGKRPYRECKRAGVAARFSGVHGPRHVRRLAGEPDPGAARPVRPPHRGGLRRHAGRCRRHVRPTGAAGLLAVPGITGRARRRCFAARLGRIGSDGFARSR